MMVRIMAKQFIKRKFASAFNALGVDITFSRLEKIDTDSNNIKINIGAGSWKCKGWLNLDHSSEWYSGYQKNTEYLEYDIRSDKLPFEDNSVQCIYCSHVVEHIEDCYVNEMLSECFRVLMPGGILRIACPDAEFLWNVTKAGKDYWEWRRKWCCDNKIDFDALEPVDLLVREVATPRMKGYGKECTKDYKTAFETMNMYEFYQFITEDLCFSDKYVGNHINYWTYEKMKKSLCGAGFDKVVKSKYGACISKHMRIRTYFDTTFPLMSLYVDAIK